MEAERIQGANAVDAGRHTPYWGEHAARYAFALRYVEGKKVLDIACGTGYGLVFLSTKAACVTGVDVDWEAARLARGECADDTLILLGDGTKLPFSDESFEVITSFETLEHLHERGAFLTELKRVLKTGGLLVLSTPNAYYTKPVNGKPTNPFHVFEYKPEELRAELEAHFTLQEFFGQMLDEKFGIPPFKEAQNRLPKDARTQARLFFWRVLNKMPVAVRENFSRIFWKLPFYPAETDYNFTGQTIGYAPTSVAVCRKDRS